MKKLTSTLPNMIISLGLITCVAGALLGVIYDVTKEPIAQMQTEEQTAAIRQVAPPFDNDPRADEWQTTIDGQPFTVYPALNHGKLAGAAVMGQSMNGFNGQIVIMAGFDADGTVRDYQVLSQAETPGLGSKMQTWFRDPTAARSVIGKNPATTAFFVTKDKASGGQIDAITAATISSRAFLETMRHAYDAYKTYAASKGVQVGTDAPKTPDVADADTDSHTGASAAHAGADTHAADSSSPQPN